MQRYRPGRSRIQKTLLLAVVTVSMLLLGPGGAMAGEHPNSGSQSGSQRIYLDPDTGEVIDHPPEPSESMPATTKKAPERNDPEQPRHKATTGPRAWKTEDGVQMLTPDPKAMPKSHAVRCPDGSMRIGHAAAEVGQSESEALCADHDN